MPLYVDRHEITDEMTAENMANLHRSDLDIQHKFNCKVISYWFDEDKKLAFRLVEAPDLLSLKMMPQLACEKGSHKITKIDESVVEAFIKNIEAPASLEFFKSKNLSQNICRTIIIVEIKPFSLKNLRSEAVTNLIRTYNQAILIILKDFNGEIYLHKTDRLIASFNSVSRAIDCAREIRKNFFLITDQVTNFCFQIKIGLSATSSMGELEDIIKLAGRFCYVDKNLINISTKVKDQYENENFGNSINKDDINAFSSGDEEFFIQLMDYVEREWMNMSFNADDFSRNLGYSKSQLYRKMISVTGKTPNIFIKKYRLDNALQLLNCKKENIKQIAFDTGFNSPAYFSKCFEEFFGVLPSVYMRQNKYPS